MNDILICSDLDRTILPNGKEPQSPLALQILNRLALREEITLAYVSGRSETLLKEAIEEYDIPLPDFAIGDVGTTIYEPLQNWRPWGDWSEEIAPDWGGRTGLDIAQLLDAVDGLELQEQEQQNTFKLSYYTAASVDVARLKTIIDTLLHQAGIQASIIWSRDDEKNTGLLDILPKRATKVHAIRYLMKKKGFSRQCCVFAGDSGNDLPALTSGLNAVLVKNAPVDVRDEAVSTMTRQGLSERLYLAKGDFLGMNGNYCAGVLEGIAHFLPQTLSWMQNS